MTNDETCRWTGNKFIAELILCVSLALVKLFIHVRMCVVVWSLTTVVANHSLGCLYFAAVALLPSTLSENRLQDVLEFSCLSC